MKLSEAVEMVAKYVRETGNTAAQATKQLWEDICPLPVDEATSLMQQAISSRVGDRLRNPEDGAILSFRQSSPPVITPTGAAEMPQTEDDEVGHVNEPVSSKPPDIPYRVITIQRERTPTARHEVTVKLLSYTMYNVNGAVKAIADFTRYDVLTQISRIKKVEVGVTGHRKMWEHLGDRMTTLKKDRVSDLAEGEQIKIARMVYDLRQTHNLVDGITSNLIARL